MSKILVIDDDQDICLLMNRFLTKNGYEVETAISGLLGLKKVKEFKPDLLLTDFKLGDIDGSEVLKKAKEMMPNLPVIVITGYSDIKVAINVMKMGAFDYVTKPLFPDEILLNIKKALKTETVNEDSSKVTKSKAKNKEANYIFGKSAIAKNLVKQVNLVAPTNFSVIIYGESGSGKEAIAKTIHKKSKRKDGPFVAMDCGAISNELAGSELFGHEKGSFTGAIQQKIGHFELANGGTLFLDEVANLSYEVQVSLLRVVQEQKVKRIGGNKEITLDVRILVASNEKLTEAISKGKFREDLYHRFNEFNVEVPALRERGNDVFEFADYFLKETNAELEKNVKGFSEEVRKHLLDYPWYGNLRELNNVIKRATLLTEGELIEAASLPFEIVNHEKMLFSEKKEETDKSSTPANTGSGHLKMAASEAEYQMILEALKKVNFNKSKAAALLDIDRKTLYNKMKRLKI
ncbi:sigma-54-dependent transcriptional regulator [Arcticibacterium luteifluviistationis]|uniref:Sigma-54-dependent Fis family transcriptional regulator n=1 Tax=Arcticibacterium luteifluviistationis TaxID=1784714 RepID=A0A2Z4GA59_9BACT|nr:sigma-54 dependent transcriptional regulator [Arcticibacterium luteifluviistationis]AWV97938.1 sigma-54-dependent Fis family transcriptional regulator [Arcticibacterium luteifluviistationis]